MMIQVHHHQLKKNLFDKHRKKKQMKMKKIFQNKINDLEIQIKIIIKIKQMNKVKQNENDLMMVFALNKQKNQIETLSFR
jgi:hypothetical protein